MELKGSVVEYQSEQTGKLQLVKEKKMNRIIFKGSGSKGRQITVSEDKTWWCLEEN